MVPTASAPKINAKIASLQQSAAPSSNENANEELISVIFLQKGNKNLGRNKDSIKFLREKYTLEQTTEDPEEHPVELIDENGDDATEEDVNPVSKEKTKAESKRQTTSSSKKAEISEIDDVKLIQEVSKKSVLWDYRRQPHENSLDARKVAWMAVKQAFDGKFVS
jgi:hypothetical protein